jgi:type II secretory pathway pseudopilin PulG
MIVIALIGLISIFAIPTVSSYFRISLNTVARQIATVIKDAYNSTVVSGNVNRLVYDLEGHKYWVEQGPPTTMLDTAETKEKEERRKRFGGEEAEKRPSGFGLNKIVTRKKISLPTGVMFEDVVTQQSKDPLINGTAYTHFFPHGIVERTIIHLKDSADHHFSLVISPITGRTELYENYIDAKKAFAQ